ncbi:unnamed protein product [Ascophyllum nodosum]
MSALEQLVAMGFSEERAQKALETQGFNVERAVNVLVATADDAVGDEQQVVQAPISQYDLHNGRSACTCICLEASLTILEMLATGPWRGSPEDVADIVSIGVVMYEGLSDAGTSNRTLSTEHTSVSEAMPAVPRYRDGLQPATGRDCYQGMLGAGAAFASILGSIAGDQRDKSRPVAVAITKPPETIVVFLPADPDVSGVASSGSSGPRQWLLFDSHPRPQVGLTGAHVQSFGRQAALVEGLNDIFPPFDVGTDSVMASMYNMVDCTPLTLRQTVPS